MKSKCLIRNAETYGIPGGWTLRHPAVPQGITGKSPEDAVATMAALLRVNRVAATEDQLWEHANAEWGRRVLASGLAERWMGAALGEGTGTKGTGETEGTKNPVAPPHFRTILTPKETGPALWGTLHLIPLVFTPEAWRAHIALMTRLIEPGGYEPGCLRCAVHWRQFRQNHPPEATTTGKEAAHWSWQAHNAASQHAGNVVWSWRQAAARWGWPGEWE